MESKEIIESLGLVPLPEEGGFYREIYRAPEKIPSLDRNYSTHIYYLITSEEYSRFHRVRSDELFHFYAGDPVQLSQISPQGRLQQVILGSDLHHNQRRFFAVEKEYWQGTRLLPGGAWALLGCTVAPGFEFADFEMGHREVLLQQYPQYAETILALTR